GPARRPARRTTLSHRVTSLGIRSRAMRVFPVRGKEMAVHAKRFFARRRVIHRSCGEQTRRALLASMNNSGGTISLRVPAEFLPVSHQIASGWPQGGLGGALVEPWWSLGGALGWLCTPESMPSIWPWGGLGVALGGLSVQGSEFRVQGSRLDVPCSSDNVCPFLSHTPNRLSALRL